MVEDRVTDGKRIAQLLASEVTGHTGGPLGEVAIVDADPTIEATAGGTLAYGIAVEGERIGDVFVHERTARLDLSIRPESSAEQLDRDGLVVSKTGDGISVTVEYGAAVKRVVDLLAEREPW